MLLFQSDEEAEAYVNTSPESMMLANATLRQLMVERDHSEIQYWGLHGLPQYQRTYLTKTIEMNLRVCIKLELLPCHSCSSRTSVNLSIPKML